MKWKPIPGYNGMYEVSSCGKIRSHHKYHNKDKPPRILKTNLNTWRYESVRLQMGGVKRTHTVHVLVCEAFNGKRPTPKHQVCHIDGSRTNNDYRNLMWGTRSENERQKHWHGTVPIGENNPRSKLTEKQVQEIRKLALKGISYVQLGIKYGVHQSNVACIVKKKSWCHI